MEFGGVNFDTYFKNYPNNEGFFGKYGGAFIAPELKKAMEEIIASLMKITNDEVDYYLSYFIASAGLIAMNIDGEVTHEEVETVLNNLAAFQIFPRQFLDDVNKQNVVEIFNSSIDEVLKRNPDAREGMFSYMISLLLADKSLNQEEVDFLFKVGEQSFGFSQKEVANRLAIAIQRNFIPSYEAIC